MRRSLRENLLIQRDYIGIWKSDVRPLYSCDPQVYANQRLSVQLDLVICSRSYQAWLLLPLELPFLTCSLNFRLFTNTQNWKELESLLIHWFWNSFVFLFLIKESFPQMKVPPETQSVKQSHLDVLCSRWGGGGKGLPGREEPGQGPTCSTDLPPPTKDFKIANATSSTEEWRNRRLDSVFLQRGTIGIWGQKQPSCVGLILHGSHWASLAKCLYCPPIRVLTEISYWGEWSGSTWAENHMTQAWLAHG